MNAFVHKKITEYFVTWGCDLSKGGCDLSKGGCDLSRGGCDLSKGV